MLATDAVGTYCYLSAIVTGLLFIINRFCFPTPTMILFALEYELILACVIPEIGLATPFLSKAAVRK